jgi:MarR family transcriptional regulator, organic hydroperoxide resistance regulator
MKKNLVALCSRVSSNARKIIVSELAKQGVTDIVPSHGSILHLLYIRKEVTMKEIADYVHKTKPTITVLVNKLEKLGYVVREKSDEDNRVSYIKLTEKGHKLKPIFEKVSDYLNDKVYKNLDEKESELAKKVLEKVLENLD